MEKNVIKTVKIKIEEGLEREIYIYIKLRETNVRRRRGTERLTKGVLMIWIKYGR
jgi:hypothetical protein